MVAADKHLVIGQFVGVFGVKGWLKVRSFTQPEDNVLQYQPWLVDAASGDFDRIEVDAHQFRPQGLIVHVKGIDDRDVAARLCKKRLWAAAADLPTLEEGQFYWHQLLGLRVITRYRGVVEDLGRVVNLMETGANDVLVVRGDDRSIDRAERLIPYAPDRFLERIDLNAAEMWVDWDPEF